jgi:molecular chaperone DnaK (HSP70)
VPEGAKRHERFKLGLCPEFDSSQSERSTGYTSPTALPRVSGNDCEKLVVDYLRSLRNHAEIFLKNDLGSAVYEVTPMEYIITVPAIWPEKAKYELQGCALKAGIKDPQLILEPEAVSIFALETMPSKAFRAGDTFVVCDAGGRSVPVPVFTFCR